MSTERTKVAPPRFAWIACQDCAGDLFDHRQPGRWTIEIEHSPTCPDWKEAGPEIALTLSDGKAKS